MDTTVEDAKAVIERMKAARPTCPDCKTVSISCMHGAWSYKNDWTDWLEREKYDAFVAEQGFEAMPHAAGYVRRCAECASGKMFPWADRLDAEKVAVFMSGDPRCEHAFALSILEETL